MQNRGELQSRARRQQKWQDEGLWGLLSTWHSQETAASGEPPYKQIQQNSGNSLHVSNLGSPIALAGAVPGGPALVQAAQHSLPPPNTAGFAC